MLLPENLSVEEILENSGILWKLPRIPAFQCNRRYKRGSRRIMRDIRVIKRILHEDLDMDSWLTACCVYLEINKLNQKHFIRYIPKVLLQLLSDEAKRKHLWRNK